MKENKPKAPILKKPVVEEAIDHEDIIEEKDLPNEDESDVSWITTST